MAITSAPPPSAARRTDNDVTSSAQTACSTCRTVFEVAEELLQSTDTRVRCGECYAIFDAAANLVEPVDAVNRTLPHTDAIADDDAADPGLDVTYSDFDLFSEDADLPEIAYFDQTRDTPEFDFDSVAVEEDQTFNDTLFAHDVTIDADSAQATDDSGAPPIVVEELLEGPDTAVVADAQAEAPLVFEYRDPEPEEDEIASDAEGASEIDPALESESDASAAAPTSEQQALVSGPAEEPATEVLGDAMAPSAPSRRSSVALPLVLVLCFATLITGLYAWRHRDNLHNDPILRPLYTALCGLSACEVPSRVALDALRLSKRNVYEHPSLEGALVIDVTFRNEASFPQRFPMLVVRLSDRSGRMVARRAFLPADYLASWQRGDTLAAGEQRGISLDVSDPGDDASSFEVDFAEAPWSTETAEPASTDR